jgi:hypothetical protein
VNQEQRDTFLVSLHKMTDQEVITQTRRANAYLYFRPNEDKAELFRMLSAEAWKRGYPLDNVIYHIPCMVENMSQWEVLYYLKDLIDKSQLS